MSAVAIIGAGPRGLSLLERLIANQQLFSGPLQVDIYDPHGPGGRIWSPVQPQHLLMNTFCGDATHFLDETVDCAGPVVTGPTLYEWCQQVAANQIETAAELRAEAARLPPWGHPSRRLLGCYLNWCVTVDRERAPVSWAVSFRAETVGAISRDAAGWTVAAGASQRTYQAVIVAAGHSDLLPSKRERKMRDHARRVGGFYGLPTNPLSADLSVVAPGRRVAVRGLGMNFFDYVSLLTVGRGGEFFADSSGLRYRASGSEPILVVGSGRGVPYRAKGQFGGNPPNLTARYLTAQRIAELGSKAEPLSFRRDLWPLIAKDTALAWYRVLARVRPEALRGDLAAVIALLDSYDWNDGALHRGMARLCPDPAQRLNLHRLDRPLEDVGLPNLAQLRRWWRAALERDWDESVAGVDSPEKCASVALGAGRAAVRVLARYGGFAAVSYRDEIEGWYRGFAGSLASGPPASRIRELAALLDAGLIIPVGAQMRVEPTATGFAVHSATQPEVVECVGLLEAHLPPAAADRSADPLLADLLRRGLARRFVMPQPGGAAWTSGALQVSESPYQLIDAEGRPGPGLYAVGVPLEGVHWGTQLGPLARTNSQFLRDTDAIARAVLGELADAAVNRAGD